MAIAAWKPAADGAPWAKITSAWIVLHALVMEASKADAREMS
jgi:hypothetical protein